MVYGVAAGLHRRLRDELLRIVRTHDNFVDGRGVKTWVSYLGGWNENRAEALDKLPLVNAVLLSGPADQVAGSRGPAAYRERLRLVFQIVCPGTDAADVGDVWDAIHDALFPSDPAERAAQACRLDAFGVKDLILRRPALPADQARDFTDLGAIGTGEVEVIVHLS